MTDQQPEQPTTEENAARPKWGRITAWVVLFTLLGTVGLGLIRSQEGTARPGKPAPDFVLTTYQDKVYDSADLAGKVVVLNFWASWCIPCSEEADELENAWQYYKDRGDVLFLGVAWSDMDAKAKEYLTQYGITYPNGPDLRTAISQAFRTRGVPETFIIGKDGILAHAQIGQFTSVGQIQAIVDPLLSP